MGSIGKEAITSEVGQIRVEVEGSKGERWEGAIVHFVPS